MFLTVKKKLLRSKKLIIVILCTLLGLLTFIGYNYDTLYRYVYAAQLGSSYMRFLDYKIKYTDIIKRHEIIPRRIVDISMNPSDFVLLQKERARMITNFIINGDQWLGNNSKYNCNVSLGKNRTKAKLKIFGMNPDHYRDADGHSMRVYSGGGKGFGDKEFNLVKPYTRYFNADLLGNIIFKKLFNGLSIKYEPVDLLFNKMDYGVYLTEEFFDKYFIERNSFRESLIFELIEDSVHFNYIPKSIEFEEKADFITNIINDDDNNEFLALIDKNKMYGFLSICYLFNNYHALYGINLHWYYNPVTNKLEPTIRETNVSKIINNSPEDSFNLFLNNIVAYNNEISNWVNYIGVQKFKTELFQNIFQVKNNISNILKDPEYLIYKSKLLGFEDKFLKNENSLVSNLNLIEDVLLNENYILPIKQIIIDNDTLISTDLIIESNEKLIISEGVSIFLDSNANIFIYGEIEINGTNEKKVCIESINYSTSSIFIQSEKESNINGTVFKNLSSLSKNLWTTPSSITVYETDISFTDCSFQSNLVGDDMVNLFRCQKVVFEKCIFKNILSDAIDSDFSNIDINNTYFENIGNDAIDGSGSKILIEKSRFVSIQDKAISAGEESVFELKHNIISNSELGIVCKDGSVISSSQDSLINNSLDLVAFIKKNEYGSPEVNIYKTEISKYLIEKGVKVTGIEGPIKRIKKVKNKLYGNEYGKSSK
jgi:hypothetical protein